ncbi:hypothetical protein H257_00890 [Aphanomyces astaci]|uniref:WRKY19-like zinc finger domain-containing protein n=1 Tax=Aphanomyces astaci TaxID=112090 RepID=W4HCJ8_APHAT|nr:hypothetical protein H257_00890 [Aphanomyces astaci]ETV89710.1 hypothetical protein H257_00890 [Aphanomyces astaci]RQM11909.1 hypothetical protein B5M09_005374 [Aphanomyces astaci]|eukprot:XP_009822110.1 hypothetical protein H257_00890 [Aphanomyces astaci]
MLDFTLPPLSSYLRNSTVAPSEGLSATTTPRFAYIPLLLNPVEEKQLQHYDNNNTRAASPPTLMDTLAFELPPHKRKRCQDADPGAHDRSPASQPICNVHGCSKLVTREGVCTSHGGRYFCIVAGCPKQRLKKGLCFAHGGVSYCKVPGCDKTRQKRGLCKTHGGVAYCKVDGCTNASNSKGLCRDHGGIKYCRTEGCQNLMLREGLCRLHGGFEYCKAPYCSRIAIEGGHCRTHTISPN